MEKNAQNREALQTLSLAAGIMDKAARTQVALQTPGLAADPSHNSTLTRIGRITRSMDTASGNSACTVGAGVMVNALMSSTIDRNLDTTKKRWPAMKKSYRRRLSGKKILPLSEIRPSHKSPTPVALAASPTDRFDRNGSSRPSATPAAQCGTKLGC